MLRKYVCTLVKVAGAVLTLFVAPVVHLLKPEQFSSDAMSLLGFTGLCVAMSGNALDHFFRRRPH